MKTPLAASLFTALLAAACSAAPDPSAGEGSIGAESQAICGNGVRPGCGDCHYDSSSSKGGYRTCWTCDGVASDAC